MKVCMFHAHKWWSMVGHQMSGFNLEIGWEYTYGAHCISEGIVGFEKRGRKTGFWMLK